MDPIYGTVEKMFRRSCGSLPFHRKLTAGPWPDSGQYSLQSII